MKKYLCAAGFFLASCLLLPVSSYAQFTTVTATVKDPNGIPYAGAVLNAVLVPSTGGGYTLSGQPYSGRIGPVTLDSSGKFTVNFGDVTLITPGSPQWQITIDSAAATIQGPLGTGPQSFVYTSSGTTISGSSPVSLTTALNALAPALTNITIGSGTVTSIASSGPIVVTPSPIVSTGTISCATCVVASSPGLGIAHFAGATQTVTSSAVNLAGADVTGQLPIGSVGSAGLSGTAPVTISAAGAIGCATCNTSGATIAGSISAGQSAYGSAANTIAGGAGRLDMKGITGADLGAIMNTCGATANVKICDGTNLTGALTLSTTPNMPANVVYLFCGQSISQTAAISAANVNGAIWGCPGQTTTFTKAANIDQITGSATGVEVHWITLAGVKGSFTGNGVVTATGCVNCKFSHLTISAEANDDVKDGSGTRSANTFDELNLSTWGVHGFESTGAQQESALTNSYIVGDGTGTGASILNNGNTVIEHNPMILDSGTQDLINSAFGDTRIIGNYMNQSGGAAAFHGIAIVSGNRIIGGGTTNAAVVLDQGGAIFTGNVLNTTNAIGIKATSNAILVENNTIGLTISSNVNAICGISWQGDQIGDRSIGNSIQISDSTSNGNVEYGECDAPASGHNLDMVFSGTHVTGVLGGTDTADGFFLNNAANLNTNWSVTVRDFSCVHLTFCLKRTDTQNNVTLFVDILPGDITLDAGTGSTNDIFLTKTTAGLAGFSSGVWSLSGSTSGTATFTGPAVAGTRTNPVTASNALLLPAGSLANPSLTFVDTANGFWRNGANLIGLTSAGVDTLTMYNGGIRMINTASLQFSPNGTSTSSFDAAVSRGAAGVVTVDTSTSGNAAGTIKPGAYATGTNCSSSASPAVCGSAAAGSVVIAAAATTVTVNTTDVTANSQIFVQTDDTLGTKLSVTCNSTLATLVGGLTISARTGGTSFQITSGTTPAVNPLCISYHIIN